jgi:hypothetical protein
MTQRVDEAACRVAAREYAVNVIEFPSLKPGDWMGLSFSEIDMASGFVAGSSWQREQDRDLLAQAKSEGSKDGFEQSQKVFREALDAVEQGRAKALLAQMAEALEDLVNGPLEPHERSLIYDRASQALAAYRAQVEVS